MIDGWGISCEFALRWMSLDLTDDKTTLVQVMAWCRQATSHYLSQCWPRSLSPYGITRPQWVNSLAIETCGSVFLNSFYELITWAIMWNLSQVSATEHWFRWWLGSIRKDTITWANENPNPCWYVNWEENSVVIWAKKYNFSVFQGTHLSIENFVWKLLTICLGLNVLAIIRPAHFFTR